MTEFMDDGAYKARIRGKWGFGEIANDKATPYFWADVDIFSYETGGGIYEKLDEPVTRRVSQYITEPARTQVTRLLKTLGVQDLSELDQESENAADLFDKEIVVSNKVEEYKGKVREKWSFLAGGSKPLSADKRAALFDTFRLDSATA